MELRERAGRRSKQTIMGERESMWRRIVAQLQQDGLGLIVGLRRWIERQDRRFDDPKPTDRTTR